MTLERQKPVCVPEISDKWSAPANQRNSQLNGLAPCVTECIQKCTNHERKERFFFIAPSDSFDLWVAIVELHVGDIERVTSSSNKAKVILRTCYDCRAMPNTKMSH